MPRTGPSKLAPDRKSLLARVHERISPLWFLTLIAAAVLVTGWGANVYLSRYATASESAQTAKTVEDHGRRLERLEERVDTNLEWIRKTLDRIAEKQGVKTQ